jgi:chromosome segregation ATPase
MSWLKQTLNKNILFAALAITHGMASAQSAPVTTQLNDIKAAIQKSDQQALDAENANKAAAAARDQKFKELKAKTQKTPEERAALRAANAERKRLAAAEMTPEVRAAREQARQAKLAQFAASNAAKAAHAQAEAAAQNVAKLNKDLADVNKPNPARGADFTPQNVTPLLQRIDTWTKRLAAIKTQNDLAGPKLAQLDQGLTELKVYMDRVDNAMLGVQRAGVQTPANKEAEALYLRAGDMLNALQGEMDRIEKLYPAAGPVQAIFAKFKS